MWRAVFISPASAPSHPSLKAMGTQMEGHFFCAVMEGVDPQATRWNTLSQNQRPLLCSFPLFQGIQKAIMWHLAKLPPPRLWTVKLRRVKNIALTIFCHDAIAQRLAEWAPGTALQGNTILPKAAPKPGYPSDCANKMQQQWKQNSLNWNRHDFILVGLTSVPCT